MITFTIAFIVFGVAFFIIVMREKEKDANRRRYSDAPEYLLMPYTHGRWQIQKKLEVQFITEVPLSYYFVASYDTKEQAEADMNHLMGNNL